MHKLFSAPAAASFSIARLGAMLVAALGAMSMTGCANFTEVRAESNDMLMVSVTGVSYTMSIPALTTAAREKAFTYCENQQMKADLRQLVRGWHPMQVELYFRCQPKDHSLSASLI
ncbi:hypothetical protein PQR62_22575 [Herbaspirillum lusitanum]|jgi:7-keto-8-aminopelargonate synthetase-like enzyme|uniref:Lipoprotein n=1 Tax=Herbaspirillum lusitanum TaxID=213312 RepID=A0ABW9AG64_9BURK